LGEHGRSSTGPYSVGNLAQNGGAIFFNLQGNGDFQGLKVLLQALSLCTLSIRSLSQLAEQSAFRFILSYASISLKAHCI
jgi:hypothetical protein